MPSIAVIGASSDRSKFGNKCVRAHALKGYDVYPVHPKAMEVEGHQAYPSIRDVPVERLDRISVYLPPSVALKVLDDIAVRPANEVWLNPGVESPEVLARAKELGLNVIAACSIIDIGVSPHDLPSV